MKKILCLIATLIMIFSCCANVARAEEVPDFNIDDTLEEIKQAAYSLDGVNLKYLRDAWEKVYVELNLAVYNNLRGSEVNGHAFKGFEAGIYEIGSSLPAGQYKIYICEVSEDTWEPLYSGETFSNTATLVYGSNYSDRTILRLRPGTATELHFNDGDEVIFVGGWGYCERISD